MSASPEEIAAKSAAAMWDVDHASRSAGMRLVSVGPGAAELELTVTHAMSNGHGLCHGGYIFMLADSAFGYACNSYDQRHLGQSCQIAYLAPARLGTRLVAHAEERHRGERGGIYDVRVTAEDGTLIAEFRGFSRAVPGRHSEAASPR